MLLQIKDELVIKLVKLRNPSSPLTIEPVVNIVENELCIRNSEISNNRYFTSNPNRRKRLTEILSIQISEQPEFRD